MSDTIECPYCEHDNEIYDYEGAESFDQECSECGEEFEVTVEYDPIFNSAKIEYENCIDCGKKYRHSGKSFPIPEKYENIEMKNYFVCPDCFRRETSKDLENE